MSTGPVGDDSAPHLDAEDRSRSQCYLLFSRLLHAPPAPGLLAATAALQGDADLSLLGSLNKLGACARQMTEEAIRHEYEDLFLGLGEAGINPYQSYYLTGFMYEKPLAELRRTFQNLGVRATRSTGDPEDHAAAILEAMAGLIAGTFGPPATLPSQKDFFDRHIWTWIPALFNDLAVHPDAVFYRAVGSAGAAFLDTEQRAFEQVSPMVRDHGSQ
ncbi:MAG: molecular chaperone TorD family protein [Rhodospirillales bacterium]|nr:molecular chaperone TorD family protein [Rhodospirillales bacterium]